MELIEGTGQCVLFATPTFEKIVSVDHHTSMVATLGQCMRHRIAFDVEVLCGNQFIDLARNEIVDHFLKSPRGFTDLFFIDADQGWDAKAIIRMLSHPQGVVCALPPKKCDPPTFHMNALTGVIEGGLFQSLEAGTGCMRIKRDVFERMDSLLAGEKVGGPFDWPHTPYFQTGMGKYGWVGEDIFFCRQLVAMGEYVWIDSDVTFTHRGSKAWKGNFYEHCVQTGLLKVGA